MTCQAGLSVRLYCFGDDMEGKYADVIIDISHEKVDRVFQYKIPDGLKEKVNMQIAGNHYWLPDNLL